MDSRPCIRNDKVLARHENQVWLRSKDVNNNFMVYYHIYILKLPKPNVEMMLSACWQQLLVAKLVSMRGTSAKTSVARDGRTGRKHVRLNLSVISFPFT